MQSLNISPLNVHNNQKQSNSEHASFFSSEEAHEHCNKTIKDVQVSHSRQMDYEKRNLDTCHFLMDRSDPIVLESCASPAQTRQASVYPPIVLSWCKTDENGEILAADYPGFFE